MTLAPSPAFPAPAMPAGGDAALLALHAELQAHTAAEAVACSAHSEADEARFADPGNLVLEAAAKEADARIDVAVAAWNSAAMALADLPASTLAGALVKALVLADGVDNGARNADHMIAESVRSDAARLGLVPAPTRGAQVARLSPDAGLLALCAEVEAREAAWREYIAPFVAAGMNIPRSPDAEAQAARVWALREAIADAQAVTFQGLTAKARAIMADFPEDHDVDEQQLPAWSLTRDLAAYAGGAA